MVRPIRSCLTGGACVLLMVLAGCSGKRVNYAEKVEGTVTLDGKALPGAFVQFIPDLGPNVQAPTSSAVADDKGFFKLVRNDNRRPGAAVGMNKVVVSLGRPQGSRGREDEGGESAAGTVVLPPVYVSASTTPLALEIKPSQTTYDLSLSSNPVPAR